jgi:hypothetical protein
MTPLPRARLDGGAARLQHDGMAFAVSHDNSAAHQGDR